MAVTECPPLLVLIVDPKGQRFAELPDPREEYCRVVMELRPGAVASPVERRELDRERELAARV